MNTTTETMATEVRPGVTMIDGRAYMTDAQGRMVPESLVKPADKLIDQTVRRMMEFAEELSAQIARFKGHCFDDIGSLQALLAEHYGASIGGKKGNITITTLDGTQKVTVQVQDQITFGPELQVAKSLVDECIESWAEGARDEIRALVNHAFQVDKEGRINRAALFQLRRISIDDDRWQRAMAAISDSVRTIGSNTYVRFYRRDSAQAPWRTISIDLATA